MFKFFTKDKTPIVEQVKDKAPHVKSQIIELNDGLNGSFVPTSGNTGFYLSYFRNIGDAFNFAAKVAPVGDAIKMRSNEYSQINKVLYKRDPKTGKAISDFNHPFLKLLENPNFKQTGIGFDKDFSNHKIIGGNVFIRASGLNFSAPPKELNCLDPRLMSIDSDTGNFVKEYRFDNGGRSEVFKASNIDPRTGKLSPRTRYFSSTAELYHYKNPTISNPLGLAGDSDLQPLIDEILQYQYASFHNKSMLINGMRPSGILVYKGQGEISDEDIERCKEQLNEASGMANAGKRLILGNDFHWTPLSENMKDGDFLKNKRDNADNIYSTLGIPLALSTQTATMTYSNMDSARSLLYHSTVLPFAKENYAELKSTIFNDRYSDSDNYYSLGYDISSIPALQTEMLDKSIKMKETEALTLNERRSYLGVGDSDEFGDKIMVHSGSVAIGDDTNKSNNFGNEV